MAIDTATKRKSVINDGIPGLALLPIPDGSIQAIDRRRLTDFYSLESQVIPRNFWVPDRREAVIDWEKDERSSTTWKEDQNSETDWVEETEVPTE